MKTLFDIIASTSPNSGRLALTCETRKEAETRLNKAFGKAKDGVWTDSLGQEFRIFEHFPTTWDDEQKEHFAEYGI